MRLTPYIAVSLALGLAGSTYASLSATGSAGNQSAQAIFDRVGDDLVIKITNTSGADTLSRRDVLTGLYFETSKDLSLNFSGASTGEGSHIQFGSGSNLNGRWTFSDSSTLRRRTGSTYGVGASSLGGSFRGVGGLDFGLSTAGDDSTTGNKQVKGRFALVNNSVVIVLSGLAGDFNVNTDISRVTFQYGSNVRSDPRLMASLSQSVESLADDIGRVQPGNNPGNNRPPGGDVTPTPEAWAGGLALLGLALAGKRRRMARAGASA